MIMPSLPFFTKSPWKVLLSMLLTVLIAGSFWWTTLAPAEASLNDDRLDGNIFVVYAGNGSLVPVKISLAQSLAGNTPTIVVYYLDDSRDSKQFAFVVSRIQEYYGRAANILPISVDKIPLKRLINPMKKAITTKDIYPRLSFLIKRANWFLTRRAWSPMKILMMFCARSLIYCRDRKRVHSSPAHLMNSILN
jgi:hypothetical protein